MYHGSGGQSPAKTAATGVAEAHFEPGFALPGLWLPETGCYTILGGRAVRGRRFNAHVEYGIRRCFFNFAHGSNLPHPGAQQWVDEQSSWWTNPNGEY
jgi:hypothetical protein